MPNIDDIIEQLLNDRRLKEGAAFSSHTYSDQPIIERGSDLKARMERRAAERAEHHQREAEKRRRRARRQKPVQPETQVDASAKDRSSFLDFGRMVSSFGKSIFDPLPERIREMRALESGGVPLSLSYGSNAAAALFHAQATLMADYEEEYEFHGSFSQYYPTYAAMSDHQLRGYFSWRSKVRAGHVEPAPLSFAFVYVYELIGGIGTTPGEQALSDLQSFGLAFKEVDEGHGAQLMSHLRRWISDYAVYHHLESALEQTPLNPLCTAALTLLRAEHAQLRSMGMAPRIENAAANGDAPNAEELFCALGDAATYHISDSRLAKDEHELVIEAATQVFAALVTHCAKRRKTDYVEGLFGYASRTPYTMFSAAVFYEPKRHPDCTVSLGDQEQYVCKDGRWTHLLACEARNRNSELGLALHAIDCELRKQLDYAYPLKERTVPKYLQKIVSTIAADCLERRAEAERRRIVIDRSKLSGIRRAAAVTQEALLTDEERDMPEQPTTVPLPQPEPVQPAEAAPATTDVPLSQKAEHDTPALAPTLATSQVPAGLTPLEARFLQGLMDGIPVSQLLSPTDPFPSVVVDSINEKLFDLIGDSIIEFDGDNPLIVEDYIDDIREVFAP